MAELVASEDAERTLNNALVAGGEPVQQAAMDVDMAEASGVRNAELEELKRQLEEKQREIDQLRAEQAAVKKGLSATDEAIPEWARVAAGIESLDAGQLQAVFKEDIGVERSAALSKSNRVEEKTERIRALGKLRRLKKAEAQTVAEYCVELERLSARAYPELDERALATTRAQQLYEQIVQWPESYYFLEAMEKEGPSAYESLKEAAMRVERRRLTLESARAQSYHAAGERLEGTSRHERSRVPAKMEKSIKRDEDDNRRRSELPNKEKEEPRHKEKGGQMQCFNCRGKGRGKGHLARECKVRRELGSKATEVLLEETKPPRAPEKRCPSSVVPPFGKKSVTSVTIFGNAWSALLDTGSEISILPQKVLQRIEEEGHRLQECPMDLRKRILDASGNRMKFLKVVEVPLKEGTGTEIILQMHVSVQKGHMLVLGTNALQAMNYTLVRRPSEDCRKGEVAEEAWGKPSQEDQSASKATVCKRVYVAPGTNALQAMNYTLVRRPSEDCRKGEVAEEALGKPSQEAQSASKATVCKRVYVAPGEFKWVAIKGKTQAGERMLKSSSEWILSGLCTVSETGMAEVPVWNTSSEPLVLKMDQEVGDWESDDTEYSKAMAREVATDMLVLGKPELQAQERRSMLSAYLRNNRDKEVPDEPELWSIVEEYNDVFAVEDRELTQTSLVVHEVDTGDAPPIRQRTRPIPLGARAEFKGMIKELLDRGIIEESASVSGK
nr:uncharacterized protein LOC101159255 [Haemonchus contortus]